MTPTASLPNTFFQALNLHLTSETAWAVLAVLGAAALVGLLFMVKGAKLAPGLAAAATTGIGGAIGTTLPSLTGTPYWPTVAVCGVVGLVLGLLLFRLFLAVLVGACFALVGIGVYGGQVLIEPLRAYEARGLDPQQQLVSLQPPSAEAAAAPWQAELAGRWEYLSATVPSFQVSVFAIVASTLLAGIIFGLLLPKLARAFWAASLGTGLLFAATYVGLNLKWPEHLGVFAQWGPVVAAGLWLLSLAYNFMDVQAAKPAPKKSAAPAGASAKAAVQ
jgi:hypothetical protein